MLTKHVINVLKCSLVSIGALISVQTQGCVERLTQAAAPEEAEPIGQVEMLTGTAQATRADGVTVQLNVGGPVFQNDVVQTGPNSNLKVFRHLLNRLID